jgi:hypothetical protein
MDVTLKFIATSPSCLKDESLRPYPAAKHIPKWYKDADVFTVKMSKEELIKYKEQGNRTPVGFKSCVPFLDAMTLGYVFPLPCDIEIVSTDNGCSIIVKEEEFKLYLQTRYKMEGFHVPEGYYENHFHWETIWVIEAPPGWSVLVTQPINRFELPYYTPSGVIDSDATTISGAMPFFVKKGYNGIVKKGTPFIQVIPIQRHNWYSDFELPIVEEQEKGRALNSMTYRPKEFPFYGAYKKLKWVKKNYN